MLLLLLPGALVAYALIYVVVWPLICYWRDPKGLRRFPSYTALATISDWPFLFLHARGYRSKDLTEIQQNRNAPILRIGPNHLSFAHVDAIRDIYGHSTTCVKDIKYALTADQHPHLFDVIDKPEHAVKRKRLSAAFAIKNLVRWEHKVARSTQRLVRAFDRHCTQALAVNSVPEPTDLTLDYNYWINLFTIEAINYICLSSDLNLLERGVDTVTAQKTDGTLYQTCTTPRSLYLWRTEH